MGGSRDVAECTIDIWPAVVKVVGHYQSLAPSKQPQKNSSYDTLVKYCTEKFVPLKLRFFRDIAAILEGFLKIYYWFFSITDHYLITYVIEIIL